MMDNIREKLVKLLDEVQHQGNATLKMQANYVFNSEVADHLLANNVTVQEWISVKDRLPEQTDPATAVLGITKQGKCYVVYYYKAAINDEFTGFYDNAIKRAVTHWMHLPTPPKGE